MRPSREHRIIAATIQCYPARWRSRHGDEATTLAWALLDDGVPWWSIALSFVGGATRERLFRKPTLRVGTSLVAIAVSVAAVPLALFVSLAPASASSANVVIVISKPNHAARQLESAFAAHHFKISVREQAASTNLVGSILSLNTTGTSSPDAQVISKVYGQCVTGVARCVRGLVLPHDFTGTVHVTIGRATTLGSGSGR